MYISLLVRYIIPLLLMSERRETLQLRGKFPANRRFDEELRLTLLVAPSLREA